MMPRDWTTRLRVPAIAAPMTDVSGPALVAAACQAGVIGAFPSHNAPDPRELGEWLRTIGELLAEPLDSDARPAPVAVNLVVHDSNSRLEQDLAAVVRGGVEVVITSVGSPRAIVGPLHDADVVVLADVASLRHAKRAIQAGVDGLVLLTAGAGGQTGWANPLAFARAVRQEYDGIVVLAGGVSDGAGILASQVLGADLAYLGTRFIATRESLASDAYRAAVLAATLDDISTTTQVTGLAANVLSDWLGGVVVNGTTEGVAEAAVAFSVDRLLSQRGVWAAGHSASGANELLGVRELVRHLAAEHKAARDELVASALAELDLN